MLVNGTLYMPGGDLYEDASVAIARGRILFAGSDAAAKSYIAPDTEIIDLKGRLALPGFYDAHIHPFDGGKMLLHCRLDNALSLGGYVKAVSDYARENPSLAVIRGGGWAYSIFPATGPHKRMLDAACPDRPVLLRSCDGHALWLNSKALAMSGIDRNTQDRPGGKIYRDPSGEPTGFLSGAWAVSTAESKFPVDDRMELKQALSAFMKFAAQNGVTSIHDASADEDTLSLYSEMDRNRELTVRISASIPAAPEHEPDFIDKAVRCRLKYSGRMLRTGAVKVFMDGVIDSGSAALLQPYSDGHSTPAVWDIKRYASFISDMDKNGFQVHVHATGDAAVRLALDGFENAARVNGRRDSRHQISHLDLVDDRDMFRFCPLGVTANFQPAWFCQDSSYVSYLEAIGPERVKRLYMMKSMSETGAVCVCSSDWPYGSDFITFNPMEVMQTAVTRLPQDGAGAPLSASERLDLRTAIKCYTANGAYANFQECETGLIEPGRSADIVVLDKNIFSVLPSEIGQTKVVLTLSCGVPVYRSKDF